MTESSGSKRAALPDWRRTGEVYTDGSGSMRPALHRPVLLLTGIGLLVCSSGLLHAQQNYPNKVLRLVVGSSAGGGPDIVGRIIAGKLSEALEQQVVVDNRVGAGTMIGTEFVARSAPDGYTLLMAGAAMAINPAMYKKVPYDAIKDFAPITQAISLPFVLAVHPSLPVKSVKELVALAKARPGTLNYASGGTGSSPHMAMELFLSMSQTVMVHIPYKGTGAGVVDLLAGQVTVMMPNILSALPYIKAARLRALGVTSAKRASSLPDIPAIAEAGVPGYEAVQWYGVLAPAGTPREIITRLYTEIVRIVHMPEVKDRLSGDGAEPVGTSPEQFAAFLKSEVDKWTKVARAAGIKPE